MENKELLEARQNVFLPYLKYIGAVRGEMIVEIVEEKNDLVAHIGDSTISYMQNRASIIGTINRFAENSTK